MPRKVVPLITGEIYHVFNRGVDKRDIFSDKVDFHRFHQSLSLFNSTEPTVSVYSKSFQKTPVNEALPLVHILAYCLLGNHFHLLLVQCADGGVSEYMKRVAGGYTSYFNERNDRSGSLFQGTFKRVHVSTDEQLRYLAAYVNLNYLVHNSKGYHISSYPVYEGKREEGFVKQEILVGIFGGKDDFLEETKMLAKEIARKRQSDYDYNIGLFLE